MGHRPRRFKDLIKKANARKWLNEQKRLERLRQTNPEVAKMAGVEFPKIKYAGKDNDKAGAMERNGRMKPIVPFNKIPLSDRPKLDKNKERIVMTLGMPMYNELIKGHLIYTMENAIAVGFDYIVILDDGSEDGSWEVLQDYASKYSHIKIYRNNKNSVYDPNGVNRWKILVEKVALTNPDWVVVRAADQIYSYKATVEGGDLFRKKLTEFYHRGIELVRIPCAHLWRSWYWYRADDVWGADIRAHSKAPIWRFDPKFHYNGREASGTHLGWHHPSSWGYGDKRRKVTVNINEKGQTPSWPIVVLHLGHLTHESKCLKFEWSMKAAEKNYGNGRNIMMPPPKAMPPVNRWMLYNGYKGFCEFQMNLQRAPEIWYDEKPNYDTKPIPRSIYPVIKKFNTKRAEEYKNFYIYHYGGTGDDCGNDPPPSLDCALKKREINEEVPEELVDSSYEGEVKG